MAIDWRTLPTDQEAVSRGLWTVLRHRLRDRRAPPVNVTRQPGKPRPPSLSVRQPDWNPLDPQSVGYVAAVLAGIDPDRVTSGDLEEAEDCYSRLCYPLLDASWALVRTGILQPHAPQPGSHTVAHTPFGFEFTPHGIKCLRADDPTFPLDTTGRAEAFRADFAGAPDLELMARYLSEAIEAYRNSLVLASATMIGCAYELALVQLATAVLAKWPPDNAGYLSAPLKGAAKRHAAGEYAQAGMLADAVYETLKAHSGLLPTDEWRWVASCFVPTFFIVRELRNDAGHPSGKTVDRDEVFSHIVNLGPTYRHVRAIVSRL